MYGDPDSEFDAGSQGVSAMPRYSRSWRFDPYHQSLAHARSKAPENSDADTEWLVWEVFQQAKRGEHHTHVGSLHAPDPEIALVLAKENYARRGDCVNLWVAPAREIHATDYEDDDIFVHTTDKMYREPAGFQGLRQSKIHGHQRRAELEVDDEAEPIALANDLDALDVDSTS